MYVLPRERKIRGDQQRGERADDYVLRSFRLGEEDYAGGKRDFVAVKNRPGLSICLNIEISRSETGRGIFLTFRC